MGAIIDIVHEVVREMTPEAARDLTDRIRTAGNDLAEMLHQAHQGRAWLALGYESWKEYTAKEFQISERHSFRLLDFVEIKRDLPTDQLVSSESQVRPLKALPAGKRGPAWSKAVEIAGGEQPTAKQVQEAVVEVLAPEPSLKPLPKYVPALGLGIADNAIRILKTITPKDSERNLAMMRVMAHCHQQFIWGVKGAPGKSTDVSDARSHGLRYSLLAIEQLKKITPTDTEKVAAFNEVLQWMADNLAGGKE